MLNLCYTGGTTGLPKGVMLSQRNRFERPARDARLSASTKGISGCMSRRCSTWPTPGPATPSRWSAATHVFITGFAPQSPLEAIQKYRVTKTILVPTMINFLLNFPGLANYDTAASTCCSTARRPCRSIGSSPRRKCSAPMLCQAYGMTETAPLLTAMQLDWTFYDGVRRRRCNGSQAAAVKSPASTFASSIQNTGKEVKPGRGRRNHRAWAECDEWLLEPSRRKPPPRSRTATCTLATWRPSTRTTSSSSSTGRRT